MQCTRRALEAAVTHHLRDGGEGEVVEQLSLPNPNAEELTRLIVQRRPSSGAWTSSSPPHSPLASRLTLSLIVAIGAQNAFVLRQGLRREHVWPVVGCCALADTALVALGVTGMAQVLDRLPSLAPALTIAGAAVPVRLCRLRLAARAASRRAAGCAGQPAAHAAGPRGGPDCRLHAAQPARVPRHPAAGRRRRCAAGRQRAPSWPAPRWRALPGSRCSASARGCWHRCSRSRWPGAGSMRWSAR